MTSPGWRLAFDTPTLDGLVVGMVPGLLTFNLGLGTAGSDQTETAWAENGDRYETFQIGTAGPWDFSNGELVWHNATFPDWTYVDPAAVGGGMLNFGVQLYDIQNPDNANFQVQWDVLCWYDGDHVNSDNSPTVRAYVRDLERDAQTLIDYSRNGYGVPNGSPDPYIEFAGDWPAPITTHVPTPIEQFSWIRLRATGGKIFYETSYDGVHWAIVHGSYTPSQDMLLAQRYVGVRLFLTRQAGFGSGAWNIDSMNIAPYPAAPGAGSAGSEWVSWGYHDVGQTGRGEFGPTNTDEGTDEPTPGRMLFPLDVDITQIALGYNQGAGLTADGLIYVWGDCFAAAGATSGHTLSPDDIGMAQGVFGDQLDVCPYFSEDAAGGAFWLSSAVAMPTLLEYAEATDVHQLAVGQAALFWVRGDGSLWGVGLNANGEFSTGGSGEYFGTPVQIDVGVPVSWLETSLGPGGLFAVGSDGNVYFAGDDASGMSGSGVAGGLQTTFTQVPSVGACTQLSTNGQTTLAIGQSVWLWGINLSDSDLQLIAPIPLQGGSDALVTLPFTTVSKPSSDPRKVTSQTLTTALTINPPMPDGPPDPITEPIEVD